MSRRLVKKSLSLCGGAAMARRLNRYRPRILMYHSLTRDRDVQDWTQVHVEDFAAQMHYAKTRYHPVTMDDLVSSLESGDIPPHAVAVTFDDGYRSNLELALPILREFDVPATVFVASGFISRSDSPAMYMWPDMITMIILSMPENELDLGRFNAGKYIFPTVTKRHEARNRLAEYLKTIPNDEKNDIVDWLHGTYARYIDYEKFPHYRALGAEELRSLASDRLITIGAHSRTHPILSRLDNDGVSEEIIGSKNDLERIIGREVTHFAYPNGRRQDINRTALDVTVKHFRSAVTTETGLVRNGINKYLLPRIGVGRSLGMPEFRRQLAGIYHLFRKTAFNI